MGIPGTWIKTFVTELDTERELSLKNINSKTDILSSRS